MPAKRKTKMTKRFWTGMKWRKREEDEEPATRTGEVIRGRRRAVNADKVNQRRERKFYKYKKYVFDQNAPTPVMELHSKFTNTT